MTCESGHIQICGRSNDLIKIQGYRFHPREVENILADDLPELQLVVTPLNHLGQTRLALFAKSVSDQTCSTVQSIRATCRRLLPRHMLPLHIELVENWPLNGSKKISRRSLQENLQQRRLESNQREFNCVNAEKMA